MKHDFTSYFKERLRLFSEIIVNISIFLPYFFSVVRLIKTFFFPWKQIVVKKTIRGFSFTDLIRRLFFNVFSRCIGAFMRFLFLGFFVMLEIIYVISLPFCFILYILCSPITYLFYLLKESEEKRKNRKREIFLNNHLLEIQNKSLVEEWFEDYYKQECAKIKWWKLSSLLAIPPLARDWTYGYTPLLDEYANELTTSSYQKKISHVLSRTSEIKIIEQELIKQHYPHIILTGEEGVGKHTIVDTLAKRIYEGHIHPSLAYKRVIVLNFEKILSTYTDQKQREEFVDGLFEEAAQTKHCIIVIQHIDRYVGSGPGRIDLSLPLEKYTNNSNLQFIGITTPFLFERYIFPHQTLHSRFTKIEAVEVSSKAAFDTLLSTVPLLEEQYNLYIPYETVRNTIEKCEFYITHIPFPEKAIDLLDSTCAYYQLTYNLTPKHRQILHPNIIDIVLAEKTHIPVKLSDSFREKLRFMEESLSRFILGQKKAVSQISEGLRRSFLLLGKRKKPIATFLFFGPTGVGKTQTAKTLSTLFFDKKLIRFDMSEYQKEEDIVRLIGSIETGHPGLFSQAVREQPYGLLLLDEIEKANTHLLNLFLTLFDEGYITDGFGTKIDCKHLIVVATSNAGADKLLSTPSLSSSDFASYVIEKGIFSAEFLNRFDALVLFHPISKDCLFDLARKIFRTIQEQVYSLHHIMIEISDEKLAGLASKGFSPTFGVRDLERVLSQEIENRVSQIIYSKKNNERIETITL